MYCPKCGTENPDDAQLCRSCSWVLTSTSTTAPAPDAKTSGLAITALVLGILSFFTFFITAIPAIIVGIVGLVKIEKSGGKLKGNGLAIAGIAVPAASLPLVLLFFAGVIMTYRAQPAKSGIERISPKEMMWVKCNNSECKAEYEMGKQAYFKYIQENIDPMAMVAPPVVCESCGSESVYRAEKCQNPDCAIVFFRGSVPNDFADRCPECGRSGTEESRKRRRTRGVG
ncbi:MAG: DUF4190 domain-containing protein [Planctomycetota bacterium]|jgi:ribosomal protein L40E